MNAIGTRCFSALRALSIGGFARAHLRKNRGRIGEIHSVYDSAINVLIADRLLGILPRAGDRGPVSIIVPLPAGEMRTHHPSLRIGDTVEVTENALMLGSLYRVEFGAAAVYRPELRFSSALNTQPKMMENAIAAARAGLAFGSHSGLGPLLGSIGLPLPTVSEGELNIYARAALPRLRELVDVISSGTSEGEARRAVRQLIGLGPGLTPSADDALVGLTVLLGLHSANVPSAKQKHRLLAGAILDEVDGRTTRLSQEFLRQSALLGCSESVMRLCVAMITGRTTDVERETRRLLTLGETSGTDTLLGIVIGTVICATTSPGRLGRG